jgi:transposase InsO family protein
MSANSEETRGGAGGAGGGTLAQTGPRLQPGGYAVWREQMDVFLQRAGAKKVHTKATTSQEWTDAVAQVDTWADEQEAFEEALLSGVGSSSSSAPKLSDEVKTARKNKTVRMETSQRVFGVLYASLTAELQLQVAHLPKGWAFGLWDWLERKFQSTESDNVGSLLRQWMTLSQDEEESFDAYRARVNKVASLLEHAKEKQSANMFSYVLLDQLRPEYKQAVLALKAGGQLKDATKVDWESVTSFINRHEREEKQSEDRESGDKAMAVSRNYRGAWNSKAHAQVRSQAPTGDFGVGVGSHAQGGQVGRQESSRQGPRSLADVQCFGCQQYGHMKRNCPTLNRSVQHTTVTQSSGQASGESSAAAPTPTPQATSSAQVKQVARRTGPVAGTVKSVLTNNRFDSLSSDDESEESDDSEDDWTDDDSGVAQETSTVTPVESSGASVCATSSKSCDDLWGVDSMASIHVSGSKHLFTKLKRCTPVRVTVADGSTVKATQRGTVTLVVSTKDGESVNFSIRDVHYHESFATNLLSWNVLRMRGWELHSTQSATHVTMPEGNMIELRTVGRVSVMEATSSQSEAARVFSVGSVDKVQVDDLVRLHSRLGHMGFDRMVSVIKAGTTLDVGKLNVSAATLNEARQRVRECRACALGKGHRTAFGHRGVDKGAAPGECLHMDTFYVSPPAVNGQVTLKEYGLVVTDGYTKYRWFRRLKSKDEGASAVIEIIRNAQTQGGCKVKRLYGDGGTEFVNKTLSDFCRDNGMELHYPPARTPQLNSIAERSVRTVKESLRTLMSQCRLPHRFWRHAAAHGVYVWNRTVVASTTGVSPFQAMFERKPSAQHWGVFGCDSYCHIPKEQRAALEAKMQPSIYLGHDVVQDCASVYLLGKDKIICSRDIEYRHSSFTHSDALTRGDEAVRDVVLLGYTDPPAVELSGDAGDEAAPQGGIVASRAQGGGGRVESRSDGDSESDDSGSASELASDSDSDLDDSYEVERIIKREVRKGRTEYLVKWVGYDESESTWQTLGDLAGAMDRVAEYESSLQVESPGESSSAPPVPLAAESSAVSVAQPEAPAVVVPALPVHVVAESSERRESRRIRGFGVESGPAAGVAPEQSEHRESRRIRGFGPDGSAQAHVVMSAVHNMQTDPERLESECDTEVVCAVSAGVGLLDGETPDSYRDAISSASAAKWRVAMDSEMSSCAALGVWEYVTRSDLPKGANVLPCKWVYKIKTDEHGDVTVYKARLTPKGFKQKHGQDYFEVYAPTGMYKAMRLGLSLAAGWDHNLEQLDVPTAFLNAPVDEDVYMEVPEGYRDGKEHLVCKLRKALYGLKQAPRMWYLLVSRFITEDLGFRACVSDPCLFHRRSATGRLMLLFLFVDDFQVSYHRDDSAEWSALKSRLVTRFNTKDMGESTWILGMRITRDRKNHTITLDQELYITKALEKYGLTQCRVAATPEVVGHESHGGGDDDAALDEPTDRERYMEMTGTVMYGAVASRPDIAHAAHKLASKMQAPTRRDMLAAERVYRYLSGTRDVGLVFGSRNGQSVGDSRGRGHLQVDVCAYADADWANDKGDRRSVTGWVAKLNGDVVSWASKKQRTVALSTCEAELYAESAAIQEVLWLRGVLKELGLHSQTGSLVYGDNQSAIAVSKNGVKGEKTKHVDIKYHFVTETVERGDVTLRWVPTTEQHADIFTKALAAPVFEHFRKLLMTR